MIERASTRLTTHFLCHVDELIERHFVADNATLLFPAWQIKRCDDELGKIHRPCERDWRIAISRYSCHFIHHVYCEDIWREVSLDMRHAIVIEEDTIQEHGPFQIRCFEDVDGLEVVLQRG